MKEIQSIICVLALRAAVLAGALASLTAAGCQNASAPLAFYQTDSISITLPDWPPDGLPTGPDAPQPSGAYPPLLCWKIIVTEYGGQRTITEPAASKSVKISVTKDELCSIVVKPIVAASVGSPESKDTGARSTETSAGSEAMPASGAGPIDASGADMASCAPAPSDTGIDFFYPAGAVYPHDFITSTAARADWNKGTYALIAGAVLTNPGYISNKRAALYFNWQKLRDDLIKKDSSSFSNYENLKTKKCTTSYNADIETIVSKLLDAEQKFTITYFDTSSVAPEKIAGLIEALGAHSDSGGAGNTGDSRSLDAGADTEGPDLLSQYIPLNEFAKKEGCITVQVKPADHKTAFLLNGQAVYVMKKKLYFDSFTK